LCARIPGTSLQAGGGLSGALTLGEAALAGAVGGALLIEAGLDWRNRSSQ